MSKSINLSLEDKLLSVLREQQPGVPCIGLLEVASAGTLKEEDLTSLQVRVYGMAQPHESMPMYTVSAEVRLNVEQAEAANGALFASAHEAVALWLQQVMLADNCAALETDDVYVDGLQVQGGDMDYDTSGGVWYAVWNMTLTGRLKTTTSAETQEDN